MSTFAAKWAIKSPTFSISINVKSFDFVCNPFPEYDIVHVCSQPTDVDDPAGHSGAAPQDGAHTGIMLIQFFKEKK